MSKEQKKRCLNCSIQLRCHIRKHSLDEMDEVTLNILQSWITPTPISSDDLLCEQCFNVLGQSTTVIEPAPVRGHRSVCFGCGVSILRSRTRNVALDCPERNVILKWIAPHLKSHLEKVCLSCWTSAYREIKKQATPDLPSEVLELDIKTEENIPVALSLPPQLESQKVIQSVKKITSQVYKRVSASSRYCLFKNCKNNERLLVPSSLKQFLLVHYQLYIPLSARICSHHLNNGDWEKLNAPYNDFTGFQMDNMMAIMQKAGQRNVDFQTVWLKCPFKSQ